MSKITFYSTKRSSNVAIPQNKVCGYRIKNPMMKKGYSDGMRADRENGVVDQRLSRYATEDERKCAGSNCEGNTNWLNHRKVNFHTPESADTQFWIKRPTFKEGTIDDTQINADPLTENIRGGMGNREITRNNFLSPKIQPRFTGDFDSLQALDISEVGKPEGLTDNKLGYFTQIKVPDPNDFTWLRAKAQLVADLTTRFAGFPADEIPAMIERELEINPPLGRAQRTINRSSDSISASSRLNTSQKLNEIVQEVQQGRAEGQAGRVALTAQLVQIFADTQGIAGLTQLQLTNLGQSLARIGVPTNHKRLGIIPRYVDNVFYNANAGIINLLFFSMVRESPNTVQYNYDKMVRNFPTHPPDGLPAMTLRSMVSAISLRGAGKRYLDLELGGVIDRFEMRRRAGAAGGFNNPDFSIDPANR